MDRRLPGAVTQGLTEDPREPRRPRRPADPATAPPRATLQFILGQRDMGEWDAFLGELEASGLQSYVELINRARDRFVDGA